jgi:hypothetical protein
MAKTKITVKAKGSVHGVKKALAALAGQPEMSNEPVLREADFRRNAKKKS